MIPDNSTHRRILQSEILRYLLQSIPAVLMRKMGQIYFSGPPRLRCSARLHVFRVTSWMNLHPLFSWLLTAAVRFKFHSPPGIADRTYCTYDSTIDSPFRLIDSRPGAGSSHEQEPWPIRAR